MNNPNINLGDFGRAFDICDPTMSTCCGYNREVAACKLDIQQVDVYLNGEFLCTRKVCSNWRDAWVRNGHILQ